MGSASITTSASTEASTSASTITSITSINQQPQHQPKLQPQHQLKPHLLHQLKLLQQLYPKKDALGSEIVESHQEEQHVVRRRRIKKFLFINIPRIELSVALLMLILGRVRFGGLLLLLGLEKKFMNMQRRMMIRGLN